MSIGRNKGSKSSSQRQATQATNYGRDQVTASTMEGNVKVEDLSDEALAESFDFGKSALDFTERNFSEVVGFAEERAASSEEQADNALDAVQTIAKDKATGVQRSQRMALYGIAGVLLAGFVFSGRGNRKAS